MRKSVDLVNQKAGRPPADDVLEQMHGLMHLYRAQQVRVLRDAPLQVTHMEMKVLGFFARHPGATQSELVAHSGRDKGQLARLVAGLRERGLLDAQADEGDRRTVRLQPSADGQAVHQALRRRAKKLAAAAVTGLTDQEHQQLRALLDRVRANLEAAGDADGS
ncbi:MAG TPA: MarR family transcriptional regulator [Ramlibacter sp.]|nr:MarR family transcriptional regulator [Ramlibacter sp.]